MRRLFAAAGRGRLHDSRGCYRRVHVPHAVAAGDYRRGDVRGPSARRRDGRVPAVLSVGRPAARAHLAAPAVAGRATLPVRGGEVFVRHTPWPGPVDGRRATARPASGRSTCTGWAGRRPTGPTWPRCSPSGSTAGRSTCPGSAGPSRRRAGGTRSAGTCAPSSTSSSTSRALPGEAAGPAGAPARQLPRRAGQPARRRPPSRPGRLADARSRRRCRSTACRRRSAARCCCSCCPASRRWPSGGMAGIAPEQHVRAMIRMCFGDPRQVPPERVEQAVQEMRERAEQPWADRALTRSMRGLITSYLRVGGGERLAGGALAAAADARPLGRPRQARRPGAGPAAGRRPSRTRGCACSTASGHVAMLEAPEADRPGGARHGRGADVPRAGREHARAAVDTPRSVRP